MKDEYIIINKTAIQKRIEELEQEYNQEPEEHMKDWFLGQIEALKQILSQSTPLIPEIEKTWEHGYTRGYNCAFCEINHSDCLTPNKQDYISNLKLDI